MNRWLYFTPESLGDAERFGTVWCGSDDVEPRECTLAQAALAFQGSDVQIILPMEVCSWLRSPPWPTRRTPRTQALIYSVEDQLAEDIDALHVAVGIPDAERRYPLMITAKTLLREVLSELDQAGIRAASVHIDADLLPVDQPHLVWWAGRWLLGGKVDCRLAVPDDVRGLLEPRMPEDVCVFDEHAGAAGAAKWLIKGRATSVDLLQGEFRVLRPQWRWGPLLLTLGCLGLMTWGFGLGRIHYLESESARLYEHSLQRFQTLYPDHGRVVDLSAQLNALQAKQTAGGDPMMALSALIEQVVGSAAVEIRQVDFDRAQGWRLAIAVENFSELERLRSRAQQSGLPIRLDSASKDHDGVKAMLIMAAGEP
ncbi:type II secretion system protein GspL [Pseudomonas sp. NPDC088368]|jgi:general secretion pathway protein L|uniref:type II secretion system protein GspL n=1 Tax=Pseudomonas sp. NPDC088368 TaxID=3364453 RepID=UPI003812CDB6